MTGKIRSRQLRVWAMVVVGLALGAAGWALNGGTSQGPFADARMIIEFNDTAQDVGIQVFLDGEAWEQVEILNPDGRRVAGIEGKGSLKSLGLTELFFESHEPSLEDLPLEEFLDLFPEGEYRFRGETVEGVSLVGTAAFTHRIPDGPKVISPREGEVVDPASARITWAAVTSPPEIEIAGYQVIVERLERLHPHRVFSVFLSAATTSVTVPPEFLELGTAYKLEVLAIEAGGNQTITEGSFATR